MDTITTNVSDFIVDEDYSGSSTNNLADEILNSAEATCKNQIATLYGHTVEVRPLSMQQLFEFSMRSNSEEENESPKIAVEKMLDVFICCVFNPNTGKPLFSKEHLPKLANAKYTQDFINIQNIINSINDMEVDVNAKK